MYVSWCIHWYWIYSANNWGICISCWVSVGPLGPGGVCMSVAVYINIVYIMPTIRGCMSVGVYIGLVLDIFYQQLGDMCKLLGVCVPFGPRVRGCMSVDVYIGIIYIMPTNGGCMSVCVNFGIRYIYCANHWRKCIS